MTNDAPASLSGFPPILLYSLQDFRDLCGDPVDPLLSAKPVAIRSPKRALDHFFENRGFFFSKEEHPHKNTDLETKEKPKTAVDRERKEWPCPMSRSTSTLNSRRRTVELLQKRPKIIFRGPPPKKGCFTPKISLKKLNKWTFKNVTIILMLITNLSLILRRNVIYFIWKLNLILSHLLEYFCRNF